MSGILTTYQVYAKEIIEESLIWRMFTRSGSGYGTWSFSWAGKRGRPPTHQSKGVEGTHGGTQERTLHRNRAWGGRIAPRKLAKVQAESRGRRLTASVSLLWTKPIWKGRCGLEVSALGAQSELRIVKDAEHSCTGTILFRLCHHPRAEHCRPLTFWRKTEA